MLHYLSQKLKFEYIEKQEIIFDNVVVVLQDAFYKNEKKPEIIPFWLIYMHYILCYGLISIETQKSYI